MHRSAVRPASFPVSRFFTPPVLCLAFGLFVGCEGNSGGDGGAPKSAVHTAQEPARHPAMTLPSGAVGNGSQARAPASHGASPHGAAPRGADSPPGALPAGHPPVPAPSSAAPTKAAETAAPAPAASSPAATGGSGREVQIGPLKLTAPEGWVVLPANPQFGGLAAFGLPRAEGDAEDARLTVSTVAGDLAQNLSRWQGQFKESPPVAPVIVDVAGMQVVTVRLAGTLTSMSGGAPKPNSKMWGAVLELPGQPQKVYLKATGPAKSMDKWDGSFTAFLKSLKRG